MKKKSRKDIQRQRNKMRKQQATNESDAEEYCGITDEAFERLKQQVGAQGFEGDVIRDSSLEKMSDIILEYGAPFVDIVKTDDRAEYDKSVMIAVTLWNYSILQEVGSAKDKRETRKMLKTALPDAESESVIKYMVERKRQMFPDNRRMIMKYELTETAGGYHLSVASTV